MTKEDMIHTLVSHSVQSALAESKRYWLSDLFERGFAGYSNLSTEQLRRELQMRGLAADDGDDLEDEVADIDGFDDDAEWDEEIECGLELRYRGDDD